MSEYGLGRLLDPETPRAAALYPVRAASTERVRRAWSQDGVWLDQGSTGTCVAGAFGHRRADGPVRVSGIDEAWREKFYLAASARYWGSPDETLEKGTSAHSACEELLARGAIDRFEWIGNWNAAAEDLRYALLELGPVCVGSNWYDSMYSPVEVGGQFYMRINYSSTVRGGHEFVINKVDLDPEDGSEPYYRMKNSWGQGWAKNGTARFRVADLERLIFEGWGDAVLIHEVPRG